MKTLAIDLETYSACDLAKSGVYRYSEDPSFEILLFGYSVDEGPVQVVDLASGEKLPEEVKEALTDPSVIKTAWNASFERTCIARWLGRSLDEPLDPRQWRDSMIMAAYLSLPLSLKACGAVLNLEDQKMTEGTSLINYFCKPYKATKANNFGNRNLPEHAPEKWETFKAYNQRDVEVEMKIRQLLQRYPVPDSVWETWFIDQDINDRGIMVDEDLIDCALSIDEESKADLEKRMKEITGLQNPNSVKQLMDWLKANGSTLTTLGKKEVQKAWKSEENPVVKELLGLRLQYAKSSVKKYTSMKLVRCSDGRARGLFQYYGANRTGRWAGRAIQLQNLPQNHIEPLEEVRDDVLELPYDDLKMVYGNVPDVLSQLIRTALVAKPGHHFQVADYSAVEARVVAWLANEEWRQKTFREGGDIYCASASQMFKVPVVKHGVNGHLRQKGKIAELALGYGGSVGAMTSMGALDMGLTESELPDIVTKWREANKNVVNLWWDIDKAVRKAIKNKGVETEAAHTKFKREGNFLFAQLPSGRRLAYARPKADEDGITYRGIGYFTKDSSDDGIGGWGVIESYGPKFLENITQAISRDLLAFTFSNLEKRGVRICAHIHDEVVCEVPDEGGMPLEEMCEIMGRTPVWADGLLLRADGYCTKFYKKD